jgi:hypothetical protein
MARELAEQVSEDRFGKVQKYERFIEKMHELYKVEKLWDKRLNKQVHKMETSAFYHRTPLKEILRIYNEATARGFDGKLLARSLKALEDAHKMRGAAPNVMQDYGDRELDGSWRMQKVADDLLWALKPENYISPTHLGQTLNSMGEIGYKNT